MQLNRNRFNPLDFLTHYWQKKPVVIRQAFDNFNMQIDENDLAGLAMESDVDARIISFNNNQWQVAHGPFESYDDLCDGQWTLLVQSVEAYIDQGHTLLGAFNFIPKWRIDDLMMSYSVPGAGVGPHVDQYDVFIVQGDGQRRWQVGDFQESFDESMPCAGLRQVAPFNNIIDEVLNTGDMIYIPPGFPHNGIAITPCINYSVGFRAPSQSDLVQGFADYIHAFDVANKRYQDPALQHRVNPHEIKHQEIEKFRTLCKEMIDSQHFDDFIGHYLTNQACADDYAVDIQEELSTSDIHQMLKDGVEFLPNKNCQIVSFEEHLDDKYQRDIWINGENYPVDCEHFDIAMNMINSDSLTIKQEFYYKNSLFFVQFLTTLVKTGSWFENIDS